MDFSQRFVAPCAKGATGAGILSAARPRTPLRLAPLIVIGTHGRGIVEHLRLGSVAERVVRTAPCPVLTVRQPQHEFVTVDPVPAAGASARSTG